VTIPALKMKLFRAKKLLRALYKNRSDNE